MNYILKTIPDALWRRFKSICAESGETMISVIIKLITEYVEKKETEKK